MESSIVNRMWSNFWLIIALFVLCGIVSTATTLRTLDNINMITDEEGPLEQAILGMEIHLSEMSRAISDYIKRMDDVYISRVNDSKDKYEQFSKQFIELPKSTEIENLGNRLTVIYGECCNFADLIIKNKIDQDSNLGVFKEKVGKIEEIIEIKLQNSLNKSDVHYIKKLELLFKIEVNIERDLVLVEDYIIHMYPFLSEKIQETMFEVSSFIELYRKNSLFPEEKEFISEIEKLSSEIQIVGKQIINLTDEMDTNVIKFEKALEMIEDFLGKKIQPGVLKEMEKTGEETKLSSMQFIYLILFSTTFCLIFFGAKTLFLTKSITESIKILADGANKFALGDLKSRIDMKTDNELGRLARSFNQMAERLDAETISRKYVENIFQTASESLITVSMEGTIQSINQAACDLLGYQAKDLIAHPFRKILTEESGLLQETWIQEFIKKQRIEGTETFYLRKDGDIVPVLFSSSLMCDPYGKPQEIICCASDISEIKKAKEKIIVSLNEKAILLSEIHHRVKNNMQVIISMIKLQSRNIKDPKHSNILKEIEKRIFAMSLVHEHFYLSKDIATINFKKYIRDIFHELVSFYSGDIGKIELDVSKIDITLDLDTAIPCGLIINELLSNVLKYAFPHQKNRKVEISLGKVNENELKLSFSDNGVGIPEDIDVGNSGSMGLFLVRILAEKTLGGSMDLDRTEGTLFHFLLKVNNSNRGS